MSSEGLGFKAFQVCHMTYDYKEFTCCCFSVALFPFAMPSHVNLIFSVDMGEYSHTLQMQTTYMLCLNSLAGCKCTGGSSGRDTNPKRGRWDMQMQTCFPTGARCQLSLHPTASSPGPIRVQSCTHKSYGTGLSLVTPSLMVTLWKSNKGDWRELSRRRNVSIRK